MIVFVKSVQTRAAAGGQRGVNGEWYEGGKFLPSTQKPKGKPTGRKGTGRVQIARGEWAERPDGKHAIYGAIGEFVVPDGDGRVKIHERFNSADHPAIRYYWGGDLNALQAMVDRFNAGERWR